MHSFQILALTGAAGAGKDTAAKLLQEEYGVGLYAFASPLKAALNAMFNWHPSKWDDREWKERVQPDIGKSPRQLAQTLGTEWGRDLVHKDLWTLLAKRHVDQAMHAGLPGIVFTDCRFQNEADIVNSMGGLVIEIKRDGVGAVATHSSELGIGRPADGTVLNVGTIADMGKALCGLLEFVGIDLPRKKHRKCPCGNGFRQCELLEGHTGPHQDDGRYRWKFGPSGEILSLSTDYTA